MNGRTTNFQRMLHDRRRREHLTGPARAELLARVAELELANYRLEVRVELLTEEVAAANARARHAALLAQREPEVAA